MACLVRIKKIPEWKPQDIFLPNEQKLESEQYSISTLPNQTIVDLKQEYQIAQIRIKGNMERYFGEENTIFINQKQDIISVEFEDTILEVWFLDQKTFDTMTQYLDSTLNL